MTDWRDDAACRGTDITIFYPDPADMPQGRNAPTKDPYPHARIICNTCTVTTHCLKEAVETGDNHGFRARLTPDEIDVKIRNRSGTIHKTCDWCGDPYTAKRRDSNRRYCGNGCAKAALRKARRDYNRRVRAAA